MNKVRLRNIDFPIETTFNISLSNIEGQIPKDIILLKNLKTLSLKGNDLYGSIPSKIGCLKKLQMIDLSFNNSVAK